MHIPKPVIKTLIFTESLNPSLRANVQTTLTFWQLQCWNELPENVSIQMCRPLHFCSNCNPNSSRFSRKWRTDFFCCYCWRLSVASRVRGSACGDPACLSICCSAKYRAALTAGGEGGAPARELLAVIFVPRICCCVWGRAAAADTAGVLVAFFFCRL